MYAAPVSASIYDGTAAATAVSGASHPWKDGAFGFHDVLDTLNPLQHIPVIGTLYRWITGDTPGDVARVFGDGLFGGPVGFATGMLSIAFKQDAGKDPGEMAMGLLTGGDAQVKLGQPAALTAASAAPAAATAPGTAAATAAAATPATPAATRASAATAAPGAFGQPPMMSLFKTPPSAAPAPGATSPAEQAFIGQNSALQRSVYGERAAPPAHAPVPLQLTGPQLPQRFPRAAIPPAAIGGGTSSAAPPSGASAAQAAPSIDLSALPQTPPVDISQRMMEALDKYAHIQQQQRGQQVDMAP
jgi:hypothetical protein